MKILVIGDPHFRFELPYSSSIKDGRKSEWENVKKTILKESKKCDSVVIMGDNFNARHNHSSVIREFVDFLNGFGDKEIHMLVGNHERYSGQTALDFLKEVNRKNISIYTHPESVDLCGMKALFIPYMTHSLLETETLVDGSVILNKLLDKKHDILFAHHAISGATGTEFFNEIILDKNKIAKNFGMAFAGHIHKTEKIGENIQLTGSIFTHEVGEHDKFIFVYDTEEKKTESIPLPVRGIYKVDWDENNDKGFVGIPEKSIVKCTVRTRGTDIDAVKKILDRFDAYIVIEQYENEREKVHFEDGVMDLSVESLLKLYAEAKSLPFEQLKAGFDLIKYV